MFGEINRTHTTHLGDTEEKKKNTGELVLVMKNFHLLENVQH